MEELKQNLEFLNELMNKTNELHLGMTSLELTNTKIAILTLVNKQLKRALEDINNASKKGKEFQRGPETLVYRLLSGAPADGVCCSGKDAR